MEINTRTGEQMMVTERLKEPEALKGFGPGISCSGAVNNVLLGRAASIICD